MSNPRVVVTGVGTVNPLELPTVDEFGRMRSRAIPVSVSSRGLTPPTFTVKGGREVKGFDAYQHMDPKVLTSNPRAVHFGLAAAQEAMAQAGIDMNREMPERVGVSIACMSESDYIVREPAILERRGSRRVRPPLFVARSGPVRLRCRSMAFHARGPDSSPNSLCASGADAIGTAMNFIKLGYADVMMAGGTDSCLSPLGVAGLDILGAVTREPDPGDCVSTVRR